jgi:hypothetical protein
MTQEWWLHSAFMPFHLGLMLLMVLIIGETVGIYIGHRPSNFIRSIIPSWIKDSPILRMKISRYFVLLFFVLNLSFAGYFIQLFSFAFREDFINSGLIFIPASMLAWFFTLFMMHCLDQVIRPYTAQRPASLLGRYAIILDQPARPDASAAAALRDQYGQRHALQVLSQFGELEPGSQVILVNYEDPHYIVKKITPQLGQPRKLSRPKRSSTWSDVP